MRAIKVIKLLKAATADSEEYLGSRKFVNNKSWAQAQNFQEARLYQGQSMSRKGYITSLNIQLAILSSVSLSISSLVHGGT